MRDGEVLQMKPRVFQTTLPAELGVARERFGMRGEVTFRDRGRGDVERCADLVGGCHDAIDLKPRISVADGSSFNPFGMPACDSR